MTVNISTKARNDSGDAIVNLIDAGSLNTNGVIEFRTGTKPANPQVAATGTLLATTPLSRPAFNDFSNGQSFANPITDDTDVDATGVCGWFRIYDRNNVAVIDGDVTVTGGGGDIEFDNINFIKGGTVTITSLLAIMPQ